MKTHEYTARLVWTGNAGAGTTDYKAYERAFTLHAPEKYAEILGSSDAAFRGDKTRYNPEDLLVSAIASCHMLWYLHLCAVNGVVVLAYEDNAHGTMLDVPEGGKFTHVLLSPVVTVGEESMTAKANALHDEAHRLCFIANSCNFPIEVAPIAQASR